MIARVFVGVAVVAFLILAWALAQAIGTAVGGGLPEWLVR